MSLSKTPFDQKPPNSESLEQSEIDILYYKYAVVFHLLKKHNIPASLFAGSLLGAARHQGIIPWDDDGDIVIPHNSMEKIESIFRELPACLYVIKRFPTPDVYFYKVCHYGHYTTRGVRKDFADLDIFPMFPSGDGRTVTTKIGTLERYKLPANWHQNLTTLKMGPYEFPAFANWLVILKQTYGDNCMTVGRKFNHSNYSLVRNQIAQHAEKIPGLVPTHKVSIPHFEKKKQKAENKQYWDTVYLGKQVPDAPSTFAEWTRSFLLSKNLLHRDSTLIDLGCGNGRDTAFWGQHCKAIGIDQSCQTCTVHDRLSFLQKGAQDTAEEFAQADILYLRFFVHAVPLNVWIRILKNMADHVKQGTSICIEVRSWQDPMYMNGERLSAVENMTDHYRRYQDKLVLTRQLGLIGFEAIHSEHGFGLSVYKDDDPHLIRIVATKRATRAKVTEETLLRDTIEILHELESTRRGDDHDPVQEGMPAPPRNSKWKIILLVFVLLLAMRAWQK